MPDITEKIRDYFIKEDIHIEIQKEGEFEFFYIDFPITNGPNCNLIFQIFPESRIVHIMVYNYVKLTEQKYREYFLSLINELNSEYRFQKFFLDDEDDVVVSTYLILGNDNEIEDVIEYYGMAARVAEEAFPRFARILFT